MICNFSSIIKIFRDYARQQYVRNQRILVDAIFATYVKKYTNGGLEGSSISRWIGGVPISRDIADFYEGEMKAEMTRDIFEGVLPAFSDAGAVVDEVYTLVMADSTISEWQKTQLLKAVPCETAEEQAEMLADVLAFAISRPRDYHRM